MFISKLDYVKQDNENNSDDYICYICSDLVTNPVECIGPCKRKYCMKCAGIWKASNNSCPLKCSSPWRYCIVPSMKIEFKCLYSQNCKISSVEEFLLHLDKCQFLPAQIIQEKKRKLHYQCSKGHTLQFYTGSYANMSKQLCASCKQNELSRSCCLICDEFYCVKCRRPKASKKCCPIGHKFQITETHVHQFYVCDICGMRPYFVDKNVFDDKICNFGICEICMQTLPQNLQQDPINTQYYCKQLHQLSCFQKVKTDNCSSCQKKRPCFKKCDICQTKYCTKCKQINLNINNKCQKSHKLILSQLKQPEEKCQCCYETIKFGYQDQLCGLILCEKCVKQIIQKQIDKLRYKKEHFCSSNHSLLYFFGDKKLIKYCSQCQIKKLIKYICTECPDHKYYCFGCKPISLKDGCIFQHDLINYVLPQGQETIKCMFCQEDKKQILYCQFCQLFACLECSKK